VRVDEARVQNHAEALLQEHNDRGGDLEFPHELPRGMGP